MPIKIPTGLPAAEVLENENIFVMNELRANTQDIRPLRIAVLNLMPTKITTETQLIRLLSNSSLQVELTLLHASTHRSKNVSSIHMATFYKEFESIKNEKFDGLIITGAPVEEMEFEEVDYWSELCEILEWSKTHVYSTFHICWAAQAGLYYHYGVKKHRLPKKMFGIFNHTPLIPTSPLLRGFDENFLAPHSRNTEVRTEDVQKVSELDILSVSPEAGLYLAASKNGRQVFVSGHPEYDFDTLSHEYFRDISRNLPIDMPRNYFPDNNSELKPKNVWRGHAHLLFSNWLNYFVYQATPYNRDDIK